MRKKSVACCLAILLLPMLAHSEAVTVLTGPNSSYTLSVHSYKQLAFRNTIRQQYDFSCGSAALATLLHYHYEVPVGERQIFNEMYQHGDPEKIRQVGFSMLDMKRYLASMQIKSDGYNVSLDELQKIGVPAIVLIKVGGYNHFVVISGIQEKAVLVSDPAIGAKIYGRQQFENMWGKIAFFITDQAEVGSQYFNRKVDWNSVARAPLRDGILESNFSNWSFMMRGPADF
ncbi:C39 family peptidase [Crenobacter sp. SG2305]|uniref:C39 family peptidase n=1 Tax=Crenobacter oryzisoli TaxID=3056844 RepID=UPI0025AB2CDB|nr:C39 family peptidase [Crenobacter sp. SG2305]MDN0084803.1 C39 family peptidase [Crenobacter sp. SG2305]